MAWADDGARTSPETLAVLSLSCRDSEQAQFDYVDRDGAATRRLVEPHRLVAAGRRWYLVAFDLRRDDWRTFRLDRIEGVRRAGPRFTPRPIPGGDAATFVAQTFGERRDPAHRAEVVVDGPQDVVASACRWISDDVAATDDGRTRALLRSDSAEWIAAVIARLAVEHPVRVDPSDEVARVLRGLGERLSAFGSSSSMGPPSSNG
jgi:predicted DNA-binding transcriptional regulator YafY